MSKVAKIEIAVIIILLLCIGLYLVPYFTKTLDERNAAKINANAAIFTSKALSIFALDKTQKASVVAKKTMDELNSVSKNPYSKKFPAYVDEDPKPGSIVVKSDDSIQTITITGVGKESVILVRTVIKPPSFVTYQKYSSEDNRDKK